MFRCDVGICRVYPQAFKLTLYYEGEVVEEYSVEETQQRTVINHDLQSGTDWSWNLPKGLRTAESFYTI